MNFGEETQLWWENSMNSTSNPATVASLRKAVLLAIRAKLREHFTKCVACENPNPTLWKIQNGAHLQHYTSLDPRNSTGMRFKVTCINAPPTSWR